MCCYWEAWERSIEEFRARTIKAKGIKASQKTQARAEQAEQTIYTGNRCGDPRFLDGVSSALSEGASSWALMLHNRPLFEAGVSAV